MKKQLKINKEKLLHDLVQFNMFFSIAYFILLVILTVLWSSKHPIGNLGLVNLFFSTSILAVATIPFFSFYNLEEFFWIDLILNLAFLIFGLLIIILFVINIA